SGGGVGGTRSAGRVRAARTGVRDDPPEEPGNGGGRRRERGRVGERRSRDEGEPSDQRREREGEPGEVGRRRPCDPARREVRGSPLEDGEGRRFARPGPTGIEEEGEDL